ncbi:MAG TPA: hypothetical protein VG405_11010 [Solirubrobacteraceae bacterium]|jgi:hypothetical protein|nr:hypothetical protein [Solirubrobacteraceae bacterium]
MEDQDKQVQSEDVEAHIRHGLQDEDEPTGEQGKRSRKDEDDDVEAHIRHGLQDEDEPTGEFDKLGRRNEQGKRS